MPKISAVILAVLICVFAGILIGKLKENYDPEIFSENYISVDEVKQFVDVIRGYHGDVDISATNKNYMVDAKSILGVISLDLRDELTVKFYDGISDSYMSTLKPFIAEPAVA